MANSVAQAEPSVEAEPGNPGGIRAVRAGKVVHGAWREEGFVPHTRDPA